MNYTQSDVDRILEASENVPNGKWRLYEDGSWRYEDSKNEELIVVYNDDIYETVAGAPILAEEVKRLRAEVSRLNDTIYRIQSYQGSGS